MAEVLEAMGFPSEWCERALSSASGIETAIDLLLQWQAQGMPQFLPSSVKPSSPPRSSSSGKSVLQQHQQQSNPRSIPGSGPTLRLLPLPSTSSKAVIDEREESPPSTLLLPSTSSPRPSSLDGLSGVNSESPSSSFLPRDFARPSGSRRNATVFRSGPAENLVADRVAVTGNSGVKGVSRGSGRGAGSSRTVDNLDSSDAVVPDAYAEERKARYTAARRAKQEKEDEKARIRQHMQEDMALRRSRHSYQSPPGTQGNKSLLPAIGGRVDMSHAVPMDTLVELQIRCPGNQIIKGSFSAGTKLRDVRVFVEHQLQQPRMVSAPQDHHSGLRPGSAPFTGPSARLSSDRQAEKELLQAARDNFEVQTNRILASAKTLRSTSQMPEVSSGTTIYFLIPFPRQEFFTELAMESTLADAQLVPRGTLVVQYRPSEMEQTEIAQVQPEDSGSRLGKASISEENSPGMGSPGTAEVALLAPEMVRSQVIEGEADELQIDAPPNPEIGSACFDPAINEMIKSGRTLEMEGERVRVRERALQAAAKRMTEAARIFRAGLPLEEGETGEAFHFPRDAENQNMSNDDLHLTQIPLLQEGSPVATTVPLLKDDQSLNITAAGVDAGDAIIEHPPVRDGSLDTLHRQAMAAAEGRMRSSQPQATVLGSGYKQEPEEAESRIGENEPEARPMRGRARIPQSSRLLSRPEKLQRTSNSSPPNNSSVSQEVLSNAEPQMIGGSSRRQQSQLSIGAASHAGPLEAALQRVKATTEGDNKGKAIAEEHLSSQVAVPSSSLRLEAERSSSLRVRLEDGNVVLHTFPPNALLQSVRDSVVPEGSAASEYGFVVPFPEPHFVEGEALAATLEEVGLVPRGTIHLTKLATRGMVRRGRRVSRRRRYIEESDNDELDRMEGIFRHLSEHMHDRRDLTYEELMELEESIGRVHVGVPEEVITTLPTHIVKAKKPESLTQDGTEGEEELDLCIVCMADMVDGEEALCLPCAHTFHTVCIRQWLLQSTCCPTCKHALV